MIHQKENIMSDKRPGTPSLRRPTAISRSLRAITDSSLQARDIAEMSGLNQTLPYRLHVANTRQSREKAYRLAHNIYQGCGYTKDDVKGILVNRFDAQPETFTLVAEDEIGDAAGTVTLNFDSKEQGLPADELFYDEISRLRDQGCRLAEGTRFAISATHSHGTALMTRLLNYIFIYSARVCESTDWIIEVNPRHVHFYQKMLRFEILSDEKPCTRVEGAPAVLLRLDLSIYAEEIDKLATLIPSDVQSQNRVLYSSFLPPEQEKSVADFLAKQAHAMSRRDAQYFGLHY